MKVLLYVVYVSIHTICRESGNYAFEQGIDFCTLDQNILVGRNYIIKYHLIIT